MVSAIAKMVSVTLRVDRLGIDLLMIMAINIIVLLVRDYISIAVHQPLDVVVKYINNLGFITTLRYFSLR
jgi:hypothetical protein